MDGGEGRGRKSRNIRHSGHRLESDRERTFRGPPAPPPQAQPPFIPTVPNLSFPFSSVFFRSNIRCSRHFLVPVFFSFQIVFQSVLVLFCFFVFFFGGGGGFSPLAWLSCRWNAAFQEAPFFYFRCPALFFLFPPRRRPP